MKKLCSLSLTIVFLFGCATSMPMQNVLPVRNALQLLETNIKVNESTDKDVRKLFGAPQLVSYYETSSVESQLLQIPVLDQITSSVKSNAAPHTTWTYVQPVDEKGAKAKRTIQVMGLDVYYKDFRLINIFFTETGRVLGYNITVHSIQ